MVLAILPECWHDGSQSPFAKAIGATVLRTKVDPQPMLWESILPDEFRRLPPGLSAIDRLLDDPVFFEP